MLIPQNHCLPYLFHLFGTHCSESNPNITVNWGRGAGGHIFAQDVHLTLQCVVQKKRGVFRDNCDRRFVGKGEIILEKD